MGATSDHSFPSSPERLVRDQALADRVAAGCVGSWHEFVNGYSNLIYHVLRRQLLAEDEDALRSVFVDTLKQLYDSGLARYEGRSTLSTWVTLVTRARAVDYLRSKRGRQRHPKGYEELGALAKEVFRLHFVEGLAFDGLIHALQWDRWRCSAVDIAEAILEVEERIDGPYLRRLEMDRAARASGAESGVQLAYVLAARLSYEAASDKNHPDRIMMEKETETLRQRVADLVERLPERERELIRLRFDAGHSAAEVSSRMGMNGRRHVYRLTATVVKKLKELLSGVDDVVAEYKGPPS